jgi:pimeloyl-ACP methyl ester carboxylesterase
MSTFSHETAPTEFITSNGIRFAYRRFGKRGRRPLVFLQYLTAGLDDWDPLITNGLALDHDVVLVNNVGVASSSGETPNTIDQMARDISGFCNGMGFKEIDVVGFSIGGMIAQQLALDRPKLLHRMMLWGTGPRGGEGMTFSELSEKDKIDPVVFLLAAFFTPTEASQSAGKAFVERMAWRREGRDKPVSKQTEDGQITALRTWGSVPSSGGNQTLKNIKQKTLIIHGNNDSVVQPINALLLAQHLPEAHLVVFPDSSHGAPYQHASSFLKIADLFLKA